MSQKTEKESIEIIQKSLFTIDKKLQDDSISLEDIGEVLPGMFHLNSSQDYRMLYFNEIGRESVGLSMEEINAMGEQYLIEKVHPESLIRNEPILSSFVQREDASEVCSIFQHMRFVNKKEEYTLTLTNSKIYKKTGDLVSFSIDLSGLGQMTHKIEQAIQIDTFVRKNYNRFDSLSKREKEILALTAEGKKATEIADLLFISKYTVEVHRKSINRKLEIQNSKDIIRYAVAFDLVKF